MAFGTTAIAGRVTEARLKRVGAKEFGFLKFRNETQNPTVMEMSFGGYSADQIAELRARRILLNEKLPQSAGSSTLDLLNRSLLDNFVGGIDVPLPVSESVLPKLYAERSSDVPLFLATAKLFAVLQLRLSHVVETVIRLDLSLEGSALRVDFIGKRAQKFVNRKPTIIEIHGTLDLRSSGN